MVEVHALAAIATKTMDAVNVFAGAVADFKQRKLSILWTIWHYIMFFFGYGKGYDHIYISASVYYFQNYQNRFISPLMISTSHCRSTSTSHSWSVHNFRMKRPC